MVKNISNLGDAAVYCDFGSEGAFIRLAKPEIMSKTITKKIPNAVKVPKIDAKKLFIKFIIKLLVLQI